MRKYTIFQKRKVPNLFLWAYFILVLSKEEQKPKKSKCMRKFLIESISQNLTGELFKKSWGNLGGLEKIFFNRSTFSVAF